MAVTKNALIRYKTIDKCLQNTYRNWTIADLVEYCSQALYDLEGRDINVSLRTIQLDIQMMRSDKLGYNAPIEVYERKYYRYSEPDFSITNIPITESDMAVLAESMEMLKQFKDFSLFEELNVIINKLEDKIYTQNTKRPSIIYLDRNDRLKGLQLLDELYQAIIKEVVLVISYKSFKARVEQQIVFHPQFLREYNNRWFLVGKRHEQETIMTLALDRINGIDYDLSIDYIDFKIDPSVYYENCVGITVMDRHNTAHVVFTVDKENTPYVLTKPLHESQQLLETHADNSGTFKMFVCLNYELERLILGFGDSIEILKPRNLRNRIKKKTLNAAKQYSQITVATQP
ncbi:MAG: WYL domain-containing protein [Nonlabens sp.]|nr:WYL domain-containing protein [Nonlabens sp.]